MARQSKKQIHLSEIITQRDRVLASLESRLQDYQQQLNDAKAQHFITKEIYDKIIATVTVDDEEQDEEPIKQDIPPWQKPS